jgi:hypothetical protein
MRVIRSVWRKLLGIPTVNHWVDARWDVRQMEILLCREAISNISFALCINEDEIPHTVMLNNLSNTDYLNDRFSGEWFEFLISRNKNRLLAEHLRSKNIITDRHIEQCMLSIESFTEFVDNMDTLQAMRRASRISVYGSLSLT